MPGTFVTECGPSPEDYHASAPSSGTGENLPPVQGQSEKLLRDIAAAKRCRKPCRSPSKCAGTWNPPSNSSAIGSIEVGTGVRQVFGKVESPTPDVTRVLEEIERRFGVAVDQVQLPEDWVEFNRNPDLRNCFRFELPRTDRTEDGFIQQGTSGALRH